MEKSGWLVDVAFPPTILQRLNLDHFQPMTLRANFVPLRLPILRRILLRSAASFPPTGRPRSTACRIFRPQRMGYLHLVPAVPPITVSRNVLTPLPPTSLP